jgi:hypothetical protein
MRERWQGLDWETKRYKERCNEYQNVIHTSLKCEDTEMERTAFE